MGETPSRPRRLSSPVALLSSAPRTFRQLGGDIALASLAGYGQFDGVAGLVVTEGGQKVPDVRDLPRTQDRYHGSTLYDGSRSGAVRVYLHNERTRFRLEVELIGDLGGRLDRETPRYGWETSPSSINWSATEMAVEDGMAKPKFTAPRIGQRLAL